MIAVRANRRIEAAFPIAALLIIVVLFVNGLVGVLFFSGFKGTLKIGLYSIWLASGVSTVYVIWQLIVNPRPTLRVLLGPGLVIVFLAFIIGVWWHRYDVVNTWDELSQWALAVKNSYLTNTFANTPLSNKYYPDYPPGADLFHYFWVKTCGEFGDSYLYVSMNMLIISFLVPALHDFSLKTPFRASIAAAVILIAPCALAPGVYTRITVDPLLGIIFGWVLYTYYKGRRKWDAFMVVSLSLGLFVLTIIKVTGMMFAIAAVLLIGMDTMILRSHAHGFRTVTRLAPLLVSPLTANFLWKSELSRFRIGSSWNFAGVLGIIQYPPQAWQREGFVNYYRALINYHAIQITSQTEYHLGPFTVSAIVWIVALAGILIGTALLYRWQGKAFLAGLFIGVIPYIFLLSFMYLTAFSEDEVAVLSSFNRYINTYLIAILLLCVSLVLDRFADLAGHGAMNMYIVLGVFSLMVSVPLNETPLAWLNPKYADEKMALYSSRMKYYSYINQLRPYLKEGAVLHIFNGGMAGFRYALAPIKVATPLSQAGDFAWYRRYAKELGYTHVFFEGTYGTVETDAFRREFGYLFLPGSEIKDYSLYEVVWKKHSPMMQYVVRLLP